MKGAQFKPYGFNGGYARARLEPLKPSEKFDRCNYAYRYRINGNSVPWMIYCQHRYHWLIGELVKQGVNVRHFTGKSKGIPVKKCKEISLALTRLRDKRLAAGEINRSIDMQLLDVDINFFAHCGGVRIHDWSSFSDLMVDI